MSMNAEALAYKWAYEYLQDRMRSLGRDGWAADCDGEIEHRIASAALSEQPAAPEAQFEAFIQASISSAPEPLRELGEFLAGRLDEDQWPTAERYLLAIATQPAEHPKLRAIFAHWNEFGPEHGFGELMDRLQTPQPAPSEPAVTDEMVNLFLGWRLPDDFYPDGGVSFAREVNGGPRPRDWWPTGTNLLNADQARAMLTHVIAAAPQPAPIDMVLHCPACGLQHIDAPDWINDPVRGALRTIDEEQGTHAVGNREAGRQDDAPVSVLLQQGGLASGGHAAEQVQEMRLPACTVHQGDEDMHVVQPGDGRVTLLRGQPHKEPAPSAQGVSRRGYEGLEEIQPAGREGRGSSQEQGQAREASIRPDSGAVSGARVAGWRSVQHMREAGAAAPPEGPLVAGSLPCHRENTRSAVLEVQLDAGVRERRLEGPAERNPVPGSPRVAGPVHRSHLCRPEDGGCGHIWRPADVPTNGVDAIKTKGKADSRTHANARGDFQARNRLWVEACFGEAVANDIVERNHRFLEEALELVQSLGCQYSDALQLVDYVYGRPRGEPPQEVGGVMVTLAGLCSAIKLEMMGCAETELERVWTKVEQIRAKRATKPKFGPLPGAAP